MIVNAVRPHWAHIVEQAAQQGHGRGLPSLRDELGNGWYAVSISAEGRKDGKSRGSVYWEQRCGDKRKRTRIGGWHEPPTSTRDRTNDQTGKLTVGWTPDNHRIMLVRCHEATTEQRLAVVAYDEYRGECLPHPVPYQEDLHGKVAHPHAQR